MVDVKTAAKKTAAPSAWGDDPFHKPARRLTTGGLVALLVKVVLLAVIDALAVFGVWVLVAKGDWIAAGVLLLVVAGVNYLYLRPGLLPGKYLAPGLAFLAVFQIFVIIYTGFIAFTNAGDQHNSTKQDAIEQIIRTSQERVPDSPEYTVEVYKQADQFGLLVAEPGGGTAFGTNEQPLQDASSAPDGWEQLNLNQIIRLQDEVLALNVPVSDDLNDGTLRTSDGRKAFVFTSSLEYDEAADTFTNTETGQVYSDDGEGNFRAESGETLTPGWRVVIGWDNFAFAFTNDQIRDPLLRVTIWTFAFAALSTLVCFALGLFLAIVLNHPTLRGKKVYRVLVILPYAFPAYLTGLVWAGMLNTEFGFINEVLLGGAQIPWLGDPWLARFSVIFVNMWLGYAYMFLVCTGALQSLPDDIVEAAKMDGAGAWRIFRSVKMPLLFVAVAPLLIATFAYNFNNFGVIYMLTRGNPRFTDTTLDIGATDIMITMVYKVAFGGGGGRDLGLASALSILIFIIVTIVAVISFRQTKALEDLN
ncbi:ABC transporter permease subunit [Microbacterium gallinarum]|uniref:Maltose/maltodextrin transport system permease protein n=1 Tax=Microbacterium gallinarum TaxID=2762209 RepID=A0ABR8WZC6_9MICO|nr:ABC transporter permease subunit [Microbacterium gallinarum]MBD8022424.1 ABC transporter permease subunit [Microbacterium gallinarum]